MNTPTYAWTIPENINGFPVNKSLFALFQEKLRIRGQFGELPASYVYLPVVFEAPVKCIFLAVTGSIGDMWRVAAAYEYNGRYLWMTRTQGSCSGCDSAYNPQWEDAWNDVFFSRLHHSTSIETTVKELFADFPSYDNEWHVIIDENKWSECQVEYSGCVPGKCSMYSCAQSIQELQSIHY